MPEMYIIASGWDRYYFELPIPARERDHFAAVLVGWVSVVSRGRVRDIVRISVGTDGQTPDGARQPQGVATASIARTVTVATDWPQSGQSNSESGSSAGPSRSSRIVTFDCRSWQWSAARERYVGCA